MRKILLCLAMLIGVLSFSAATATSAGAASRANCSKYDQLFRKYKLPVSTFRAIAWRESGCNPRSFVMNRTDSGGGLLGINLKGRLGPAWYRMCHATLGNITNAEVNIRCAAAAYRTMGMRPWRVSRR